MIPLRSNSKFDASRYHEAESRKDGCIHDEGSGKPARRSPNLVADREEQAAHEDEALEDEGPDRIVCCADHGT